MIPENSWENHGYSLGFSGIIWDSSSTFFIGQLQVGFEMLFWGLAGFVNPESLDKKEGLGADALAEFAGVDEHDEFFKDNAIEVIQDHQ